MTITIKINKLDELAVVPKYAKYGDAGMDICSIDDLIIKPGEWKLVRSGISAEIPYGYEIQVRPRSGLAYHNGIFVLNSPGTIDAGYRDDIGIILANFSDKPFEVKVGDRVAQLVVNQLAETKIIVTDTLSESERGTGGFGHTGT